MIDILDLVQGCILAQRDRRCITCCSGQQLADTLRDGAMEQSLESGDDADVGDG
jgi:hypothetical protein